MPPLHADESTIPLPHTDEPIVTSLLAKSQWAPHPALPTELIATVSKFVKQLPELHCEDPIDGERYPWPNFILDRLQDFAFTKGFAIVTLSGSQQKGRMRYGCVHHGKPRDTRKLDNPQTSKGIYCVCSVNPDTYNVIVRKRQTTTLAKGCDWAVTCILKDDDSGLQEWVLTVSEHTHSH